MKIATHPLLDPYLGWPVVLDSNLLLLYWFGSFDPSLVKTYKRLDNSFGLNDLLILDEALACLGELLTTPHVLTEVSNLANALPSWRKTAWSDHIAQGIELVSESFEPAAEILEDRGAAEFGLTDAALTRMTVNHLILTIDWRLAGWLQTRGLAAVNFKHLRPGGLFA